MKANKMVNVFAIMDLFDILEHAELALQALLQLLINQPALVIILLKFI